MFNDIIVKNMQVIIHQMVGDSTPEQLFQIMNAIKRIKETP